MAPLIMQKNVNEFGDILKICGPMASRERPRKWQRQISQYFEFQIQSL